MNPETVRQQRLAAAATFSPTSPSVNMLEPEFKNSKEPTKDPQFHVRKTLSRSLLDITKAGKMRDFLVHKTNSLDKSQSDKNSNGKEKNGERDRKSTTTSYNTSIDQSEEDLSDPEDGSNGR